MAFYLRGRAVRQLCLSMEYMQAQTEHAIQAIMEPEPYKAGRPSSDSVQPKGVAGT